MMSVVFDVGNVLIDWDARRVYSDFFDSESEIDAFFAEIGFHAWNLEQDRGRPWAEAVAWLSARHPDRAGLIARYDRDWQRSVSGAIAGSVALLDRLAGAGVPLYAITNFSAEKWAESRDRFPFLATRFRDVVVSAHEGLVKPDPAIFHRFLARNGLAAPACVFIDDSPGNVAAARALGMDAVLFEGAEPLAAALRDRGLPA